MGCVGVGAKIECVAEDRGGMSVGEIEQEEGDACFESGYALGGEEQLDSALVARSRGSSARRHGGSGLLYCNDGRWGCLLLCCGGLWLRLRWL